MRAPRATDRSAPSRPLSTLAAGVALTALLLGACGAEERVPPPAPSAETEASAMLTVGAQPQQTFRGLGFSFEQDNPYPALSEERKAVVDELLYGGLDARIVRLWYGPGEPQPLRDYYQTSGIIPRALDHGVTELLLGPWNYLGDPDTHARAIADDIRTMREAWGIPITATGVVNEPSAEPESHHPYLPVEHYAPLAVAMRREVAANGLGDVTLIGPEFASADWTAVRWFDTVAEDPAALAATDAIATHSYNMAANRDLATRALDHGKEYWMTEAGGGPRDGNAEFDYGFGASASARFLNDLNNAVTHWVWFVGLGEGHQDVLQKLVMCEGWCRDGGRIYTNFAYHHVKQVSAAFPPGTVMRHVRSDLDGFGDLVWTYGAKPPLHAAAGVRPDGRWAIGVVNSTPGGGGPHSSWDPPADYRVTIDLPELAGSPPTTFQVCRTGPERVLECEGEVVLEGGRATIALASLELATLVQSEPSG
jgi:hypothetical protein